MVKSSARSNADHPGTGDPGDVGVQRVGRLEREDGPPGTAVRQAPGSGAPRSTRWPRTRWRPRGRRRLALPGVAAMAARNPRRGSVGIPVPKDPGRPAPTAARRGTPRAAVPAPRWCSGGHADVELRRVVPVHEGDVATDARAAHDPSPRPADRRSRMDSAWASEALETASASTAGATLARPVGSRVITWTCLRKSSTRRSLRTVPTRRWAGRGWGPRGSRRSTPAPGARRTPRRRGT